MTAVYLLIQLIYPACMGIALLLNLEFFLYSEEVYVILTAVLTVLVVKKMDASRWNLVIFPVTVIICILEMYLFRSLFAVPSAVVRCVCAWNAMSKVQNDWRKYIALAISALMIPALIGMCGFDLTFGTISQVTVVEEAESPDGKYTACLIDADYGATGGDTLVRIYGKQHLTLGIGGFRPKTRTIYQGHWGAFKDMTISWQDERTLLINEIPHTIR